MEHDRRGDRLRQGMGRLFTLAGQFLNPPESEHEKQRRQEELDKQTKEYHTDLWDIEARLGVHAFLHLNSLPERDLFHQSFVNHTVDVFCRERRVVSKSGRKETLDPKTEAFLRGAYFKQHRSSEPMNPRLTALEGEINTSAGTLTRIITSNPAFSDIKTFLLKDLIDRDEKRMPRRHLSHYPTDRIEAWRREIVQDVALQNHADRIAKFHESLAKHTHNIS